MSIEERFWAKVARGSSTGCWLWCASTVGGYGQFAERPHTRRAHRVAFRLANGRDPVGVVRHTCDVPLCCNPAHLVEGSALDNAHDAIARGRNCRGEKSHHAKITEEDVVEMRRLRATGASLKTLAAQYGLSVASVSLTTRGRKWKHVPIREVT